MYSPLPFGGVQKNKVHPAVIQTEAVRAAERSSRTNTENQNLSQVTATAATEISVAPTETHVQTVYTGEIPMAMEEAHEIPRETDNAVAEISGATSEIPVTDMMSSVFSMVTNDTILKIFTATLKDAVYSESFTEAEETKEVSQVKVSSVSLDSSAVVKKQRGGSPVCVGRVERKEAQTEGAKTLRFTLSLIRKQQLMNRGLMNLGNSCYMNASLQCLFHAESFCTQLSSQLSNQIHNPSAQLIRCFTDFWWMRESADWRMKASLLMELIEAAAATNPDFSADIQNDAHEFLFHVLGQMQQTGQMLSWKGGVAYECPVQANFGFQLTSIITCGGCGTQRSSEVDFNHLALALSAQGSVKDCLRLFFSDEADVECRCEVCECNSASCRWAFRTLPRILVLQLKRFQVSSGFTLLKQHSRVHIDTELQLTQPVQRIPQDHTHKEPKPPDPVGRLARPDEDRKAGEGQAERNELGESVFRYRLVSVLNHIGRSEHAGHYVSDCSSQSDSCWLSYDDESITMKTMKTEERVVKQRQRSAYVLFYEMK
ncbi:hypothetical protein AOLI_G00058090 [Acnodon oligacanthus]